MKNNNWGQQSEPWTPKQSMKTKIIYVSNNDAKVKDKVKKNNYVALYKQAALNKAVSNIK